VKEASNNNGYEAKNDALNTTLHYRSKYFHYKSK